MTFVESSAQQCPACGATEMRILSGPRPDYVNQCRVCDSAFFNFGPAAAISHNDQYQDAQGYQNYLDDINSDGMIARNQETLTRLMELLRDVDSPSLFDVGAGAGDFLNLARSYGFRIGGNEISLPAIEACRSRHGIELALGDDLALLSETMPKYDSVTMWCVIAHVDEPRALLSGVRKLLRPGGILFFSTPRYCLIDRIAVVLLRMFGDRFRRVFDRRINGSHRRQYSVSGIEALLRSEGFKPISVSPSIGYGLQMHSYLRSIGFPNFVAGPMGAAFNYLAKLGAMPRNVLNVYAEAI